MSDDRLQGVKSETMNKVPLLKIVPSAGGSEAVAAEERMAAQVAKVQASLALLDTVRRRKGVRLMLPMHRTCNI